jgi:hypothetical protein
LAFVVIVADLHNVSQPTDLPADRTTNKRVVVVWLALIVEDSFCTDLMQ